MKYSVYFVEIEKALEEADVWDKYLPDMESGDEIYMYNEEQSKEAQEYIRWAFHFWYDPLGDHLNFDTKYFGDILAFIGMIKLERTLGHEYHLGNIYRSKFGHSYDIQEFIKIFNMCQFWCQYRQGKNVIMDVDGNNKRVE